MQPGGALDEPPIGTLARSALTKGREAIAANDMGAALAWLDRAHRLVPRDANATLMLASACLAGDPERAARLFLQVTEQHDVRQAWLGLAAARLRLDGPEAAAGPLASALSRHAFMPDAAGLADSIALRDGWCGLRSDGKLEIRTATPMQVRLSLDGEPICGPALPAGWERRRTIDVSAGEIPLLGSPIQIAAIRRLAGCVEVHDDGIRGWAWHPGDPATQPVLTVCDRAGQVRHTIVLTDETTAVADTGPLARPRWFETKLPDVPGLLHVLGPDGTELSGSPLDLRAEAAAPLVRNVRAAIGVEQQPRAVTIVITLRDGGKAVLASIASVLASVPAATRILVVDDGSTDRSLVAALDDLAARRKLRLLRRRSASGTNAGIQKADGRDVVLLQSDTLVPPAWLERLSAAAYASPDIGIVTPISNETGPLGYPGPGGTKPPLDQAIVEQLDRLANRANAAALIDVPIGATGCMYLRRDCLDVVGALRAELFAQGDAEAVDFCLRAHRLGWRHVALPGLFVGRGGGAALDSNTIHLRARNERIIERLHPGHFALVAAFHAADPLALSRRRIDLLVWRSRASRWAGATILIAHNEGGGVEQRLTTAVRHHSAARRRPIILRPAETASGEPAIEVRDAAADDLCSLIYMMPGELPALLRLLRAARPATIEAHHLALQPPAIHQLIAQLDIPFDAYVHDYALFCPRVSLVNGDDRYCGEPELAGCEACVSEHGHFMAEQITVESLRRRSAALLSAARRVVVPSDDAGVRMRRHFSQLATETVRHEDDAAVALAVPPAAGRSGRATVCVVGAIGVHKGYDVLLECARDAARRGLELTFVVVGHTIDDAGLMDTGRVFVTGQFEPAEAVSLIAAQHATLGFVPSICPETWCLCLSDLWRAGLIAAAFDIGAQAERIRQRGQGILLPLGLPAGAINDLLAAAARQRRRNERRGIIISS